MLTVKKTKMVQKQESFSIQHAFKASLKHNKARNRTD